MKYLLDTNICIYFFRGKHNLIEQIENIGTDNCAISEITLAELVFGAENSLDPSKNHSLIDGLVSQISILPIFNCISFYGKEKARLRKIGMMISDFDLLIGATAVANDLIMVTQNKKEFERIEGIVIENWVNGK